MNGLELLQRCGINTSYTSLQAGKNSRPKPDASISSLPKIHISSLTEA
jgi:hypothetical protein